MWKCLTYETQHVKKSHLLWTYMWSLSNQNMYLQNVNISLNKKKQLCLKVHDKAFSIIQPKN